MFTNQTVFCTNGSNMSEQNTIIFLNWPSSCALVLFAILVLYYLREVAATVIVIFQFVGILFNFVVTLQLPPRIMGDIVFLPLPDKMIRNLPFP